MNTFLDELQWRGLLHQTAGQGIEEHLIHRRVGYTGFDPTSDSLHIGNLLQLINLMRWEKSGNLPIVLLGGATGLIGDPSGKDVERQMMDPKQVQRNVEAQEKLVKKIFQLKEWKTSLAIVNNFDWLQDVSFIDILRDVGKHFSVNAMLERKSVKSRLENREQGISFTEFSYIILQAFDFLALRNMMSCTVQLAGSDQFGNIAAGIDLIRRHQKEAFGITTPLLTKADGKKFGKSEKGNIWLSPDKTTPFEFFQFWLNTSDDDVINFLKWFTLKDRDEIEEIERLHDKARHKRLAQNLLAEAVTTIVHSWQESVKSQQATMVLFGKKDIKELDEKSVDHIASIVPRTQKTIGVGNLVNMNVSTLLVEHMIVKSKRIARELINNNAVRFNGTVVTEDRKLTDSDLLFGKTFIRKGKKTWHVVEWR